jgi:hypothetical protein
MRQQAMMRFQTEVFGSYDNPADKNQHMNHPPPPIPPGSDEAILLAQGSKGPAYFVIESMNSSTYVCIQVIDCVSFA